MIPAGNKAKRLSSVNHTTKTIYRHQHYKIIDIPLKYAYIAVTLRGYLP